MYFEHAIPILGFPMIMLLGAWLYARFPSVFGWIFAALLLLGSYAVLTLEADTSNGADEYFMEYQGR